MDKLSSFLHPHDVSRVEVTARIGVACFASFCLAVANIPTVVPLSTSYLLGILGGCFAVVFPYLLCGIGMLTPWVMTVFIYPWLTATALLAAATVSNGLMVAMYAIVCLFITQLYWGKTANATGSMPGFLIALTGMFGLAYRPLVQDGLQFSVEDARLGNATEWMQEAFSAICDLEGLTGDCWEDQLDQFPFVNEVREITLPESAGIVAGQTAFVTATNSTLSVDIPGGLWIVKGLWTWSGLDNPLAAFRNFMIAVCWVMVCWYVGILLPPVRRLRRTISRAVLPAALKVAAQTDSVEALNASKGKLTHLLEIISGGKVAMLTIFEPRLFSAPTEFIVPQLKALVVAAEEAMLASGAAVVWNDETAGTTNSPKDLKNADLQDAMNVLSVCAEALASNEDAAIESLKQIKAEKSHQVAESLLDASHYVRARCDKVVDTTLAWLNALNQPHRPSPCSKEGSKNLFKTYSAWLVVPFLPLKRWVETLTSAFHSKSFDWYTFLWSAKLTAGFTGLFCASVYSEAWGNFSIEPNYTSGGVFAGWQLIAFVFVTRPTVEGTVKKGLQRTMGIAFGGFMAWLGIIVCSGSWNATGDEVNQYGLIAWLTIWTTIAGYFTIDPGAAAMKGFSYDHGYIGAYFVEHLTLIALEVYRNQGSNNAIAANRIVSNIGGLTAAMVLGLIPPFVKGNDPKHPADYLTALEDAFAGLLTALLDEEEYSKIDSGVYKAGFLQDASTKHQYASWVLKDAGRLKFVTLPFFHQDERLVPLMEAMGVTESFLRRLLELAVDIVNNEDLKNELAEGMAGRTTLQGILVQHEGHTTEDATDEQAQSNEVVHGSTGVDGQDVPASAPDAEETTLDTVSLFLYLAKHIVRRYQEHKATLSQIRVEAPGKSSGDTRHEADATVHRQNADRK